MTEKAAYVASFFYVLSFKEKDKVFPFYFEFYYFFLYWHVLHLRY